MKLSLNPIAAVALLASSVSGFGVNTALYTTKRKIDTKPLYSIRCEEKYYQLEEMEDKENCTTELFLLGDGNVIVGTTDGPQWEEAVGRWEVRPGSNDFKMDIIRRYAGGLDHTDVGEFSYVVDRTFIGEMTNVGGSVGITGVMIHFPSGVAGPDYREVGFFNMIDGTEVREDRRPGARIGVEDESPPFW